MKFKIIRRVALRKTYEFVEIHAEKVKNINEAQEALQHLEVLADYAREAELDFINAAHRRSKS